MTDSFSQGSALADWESEGGALRPTIRESPNSAYFREREARCRTLANECSRSGMRNTYLGFAARYASLARYLETPGYPGVRLKIV